MTTTTDAGLELASMEVDCTAPNHGEFDMPGACYDCKGTCRVPRFPGVRVPCRSIFRGPLYLEGYEPTKADREEDKQLQQRRHEEMCSCQGRRWTVSDRLEDWIEAADVAKFTRNTGRVVTGEWICQISKGEVYEIHFGLGDTPLEALKQALLKAEHA